MSRRSLVFGAALVGSVPFSGLLSACSWVTSEPATTEPSPEPTPAEDPASGTPDPDPTETPDPDPTPSPTPTPSPEQVLYVAGDLRAFTHIPNDEEKGCYGFPSMRAGLLVVNEDLEIQADWAEVWETVNGGSVWLFRIRRNEQGWVSGAPVTAHDFVAAWQGLLDPEQQTDVAWRLFDIENARAVYAGELPPEDLGVVATDDWTLEVRLERPRRSFPALVASRMLVPTRSVESGDASGCDSNGPYYFSGERDEMLDLVPYEAYWDADSVSLDRIQVSSEGPARSIDLFRQGDADMVRLSLADLPRARGDINLGDRLRQGMPTRLIALIPQVDAPPFDDPDIRRALGLIIDRRRLELIVEGRVTPARQLIAEGLFPELDEIVSGFRISFDIDAGLELIASSSYPDPAEWPEFGLTIPQGNSYMERVARDLSNQFEENLGITVPVELIRIDEYEAGVRERRFPLTWVEWSYRYPDPACAYADLFAGFLNSERPAVWTEEQYDELVRVADSLADRGERMEMYAQCEALLRDEGVYVPLVHPVEYYLIQSWVRDIPRDSDGRVMKSDPFQTRFSTEVSLARRTS